MVGIGLLALGGCGDDGPPAARGHPLAAVAVVEVAAQPCDRPTKDLGLGVVVGDGLVATAAHTVDGPRRTISVDGAPAEVVALDARSDLALLAAPTGGAAPAVLDRAGAASTDATSGLTNAAVVTPAGRQDVHIVRTGPLIVHNVSDGTRSERLVHTFEPGVVGGTSGAPLVAADGTVAGIVVLDRGNGERADAATAGELALLLSASGAAATPPRASTERSACTE